MADGTHDKNGPDDRPAKEAALSARLRNLGTRLGSTKLGRTTDQTSGTRSAADRSAMARGLRLSTELVAGVVVGAMLGWLLDRWLGISPWGLIVFLMLGFAAGVLNVIRAAGVVASNGRPGGKTDKR